MALAALFGLVRDGNAALDKAEDFNAASCLDLLRRMDSVFGFIFFGRADASIPADVQAELDARAAARKAKNWAESDRIRDALRAAGWEVKDTPQGQKVRRL